MTSLTSTDITDGTEGAGEPRLDRSGVEIQAFRTVRDLAISLSADTRMLSCDALNHVLADSMMLQALYKKHHWLMRGPTFYQLHLLLDVHAGEQLALIDLLAERIQMLGGVAVGDPRLAAELTCIPRPPDGVEQVPTMLSRLLDAHETVISHVREEATAAATRGDDGTNDLLVSDVLRRHEMQVWFLGEHLVDTPLLAR